MFDNLIEIEGTEANPAVKKHPTSAKPKKKSGQGCDACPSKLNWKHGVKPIFGEVTGKRIFVWAQSPGMQENKRGTELIGPSGDWLWKELKKVGITRDQCDLQNSVRCVPADYQSDEWPPLQMRSPSKEEIKCCSIYTQQAIEKSRARIHLIFGAVAHKAILGQEYKKARKTFYSSKLKGSVFLLDHPSFFLRSGFGGKGQSRVPTDRLKIFRRTLRDAAEVANQKKVSKFSYLLSQKYIPVESIAVMQEAYAEISERAKKYRIAVDSEYGNLNGKKTHLCVAFITEPGKGYVFPTDHPEISSDIRESSKEVVAGILSDADIRKVFHHGNSDTEEFAKLLGVEVRGYEYDTEYAEYFAYPVEKQATYGLEAIGDRRFPKFGGWKEVILPEAFRDDWLEQRKLKRENLQESQYMKLYEAARKEQGLNYAQVPWKKIYLRCAADADITKRIELTTKKRVPMPLMSMYRDAAFVLGTMEDNGPLFDYQHLKPLRKLYPIRIARLKRKIRKVAAQKDFNPGSPKQVEWLLYDKLKLEFPFDGKRNTQKDTLTAMLPQHPVCALIGTYRKDAKTLSTYMNGFEASANLNRGRLRTKWWLTGTRTGRLSSGGGAEKIAGDKRVVNLQNIHGDPQLQCLAISDPRWREVYQSWKQKVTIELKETAEDGKKVWHYEGGFAEDDWQEFEDYQIFLGFDFAQMELRFLAELSGDREYAKMFVDPKNDPHSMVGHALTGWDIEKIKHNDRIRRIVKALHFGIIYGLKAPGLVANLAAQGIKVTVEKMQSYTDKYFQRFRGVKNWLDNQVEIVGQLGYTETIFGFRRLVNVEEQQYLGNEWKGSFWQNIARNSPIQGGAHQMMLLSVAALKRKPEQYRLLQKPQLEVHDAAYFGTKLKNMWRALTQGVDLLEKEPLRACKEDFNLDWHIPLKAEAAAGFRFGVKVKGIEDGEWTTAKFLNQWCQKNRELQLKLKAELQKVA